MFNDHAPLLTDEDIKIFKADPEIRANLIHSTELFMKFLGMKLVVKGKSVRVLFDSKDTPDAEIDFIPIKKDLPPAGLGGKPKVEAGETWEDLWKPVLGYRRKRIFGNFNHNHLRMTRLLLCLVTCGLEKVAKAIYDFIVENDADEHNPLIPAGCWEHWDAAMEGKSIPSPKFDGGRSMSEIGGSHQSISDTDWESAKADYDEIMSGREGRWFDSGEFEYLKQQWFDQWAKKLLEMASPDIFEFDENLWDEKEKD